jgi:hypothetical protein
MQVMNELPYGGRLFSVWTMYGQILGFKAHVYSTHSRSSHTLCPSPTKPTNTSTKETSSGTSCYWSDTQSPCCKSLSSETLEQTTCCNDIRGRGELYSLSRDKSRRSYEASHLR